MLSGSLYIQLSFIERIWPSSIFHDFHTPVKFLPSSILNHHKRGKYKSFFKGWSQSDVYINLFIFTRRCSRVNIHVTTTYSYPDALLEMLFFFYFCISSKPPILCDMTSLMRIVAHFNQTLHCGFQ